MYTDKEILELLPPSRFKHLGVRYLRTYIANSISFSQHQNIFGIDSLEKAEYVFSLYDKYKPISKKTRDKLYKYFKIIVDESLCQ